MALQVIVDEFGFHAVSKFTRMGGPDPISPQSRQKPLPTL